MFRASLVVAAFVFPAVYAKCYECVCGCARPANLQTDPLPSPPGTQFASSGVALRSWTATEAIGGPGARGTDLQGYVSPSGREYAVFGLADGPAFIEVTDPEVPVVVERFVHPIACCTDMTTYREYAYVVTESGGGMRVYDMGNIDSGAVALVRSVTEGGLTQAHNVAVNPDSEFAFVVGARGNASFGGVLAYSLADPSDPRYVGSWGGTYVHDILVMSRPEHNDEIAFMFNAGRGVGVLNVTNKTGMWQIGPHYEYPHLRYAHQGWLSEDRKYLYINDEFDEEDFAVNTTTYVFNVEDARNPHYLREFTSSQTATDHNLTVRGDFIFEANYRSGLRIIHAPSPAFMQEVGWFDTHPQGSGPGFFGAWGVYTDLPSGNVLVSDQQNGLFIFDTSQAETNAPELPVGAVAMLVTLAGVLAAFGLYRLAFPSRSRRGSKIRNSGTR